MDRLFTACFTATLQCFPFVGILLRKKRAPDDDSPDEEEPVKKPTIVVDFDGLPFNSSFDMDKDNRRRLSSISRSPGDRYFGKVTFTTQYLPAKKTLIMKAKECSELDLVFFDTDIMTQLRVLVPCAKMPKQQTGFVSGFQPTFDEVLLFTNIEENDLLACKIRFRIYTKSGRSKPLLRGEAEFPGKQVQLDGPQQTHTFKLGYPAEQDRHIGENNSERRSKRIVKNHIQLKLNSVASQVRGRSKSPVAPATDSLSPMMHRGSTSKSADSRRGSTVDACGRFCSLPNNDKAELLVSLCYYSEHGRLIVGVERGSLPLINDLIKAPDTFVKIVAQGEYGNEVGKQKTETVKSSAEPRYDYSASFQIPKSELESMSIVLQVWTWSGVLRRKSQIGWFAIGLNSTSPDAQEHWQQMIQGMGTTVSKWHAILAPE